MAVVWKLLWECMLCLRNRIGERAADGSRNLPPLQPWHGMCYKYSFVWAGVAQSGRAADL